MPILDNSTRWNSTYNSLERGILLRERLDVFIWKFTTELEDDRLTEEDWQHLNEISDALQPFHEATKYLEGHARKATHGSVWEALPIMEALLEYCEQHRFQETTGRRSKNIKPTHLEIADQNAWEKLTKYYKLTDEAHTIYAAATLLHPSHRKAYFMKHWIQNWRPEAMITTVKDIWLKHYSHLDSERSTTSLPPFKKPRNSLIDQYLQKATPSNSMSDNFDSYINGTPTEFGDGNDVFAWLDREGNTPASIRQFAYDLLSIPAMSAEIERVFSSAINLLSDKRNSLVDDTIERLELLKYWWKNNIVAER